MPLPRLFREFAHRLVDRLLGPRNPHRWRAPISADDLRALRDLTIANACVRWFPDSEWQRVVESIVNRLVPRARRNSTTRIHENSRLEIKFQMQAARRGSWKPTIRWRGLESILDAIGEGRGVVLWMSDTGFDSSVGKWALHKAGIQVHHLSRPEHGYSYSRFGLRVINRLRTEVEDQWLASRIRVEGQATGAMRKANRILRQGGVVSIKAGAFEGAQFLEVTRGPRRFRLGAGAPGLCHSSGAALFGVFVSRMQGQDFHIHVGSKIEVNQDSDRRQASLACAAVFADQINAFIELHPGQWLGGYEIPLDPERPATLVQA